MFSWPLSCSPGGGAEDGAGGIIVIMDILRVSRIVPTDAETQDTDIDFVFKGTRLILCPGAAAINPDYLNIYQINTSVDKRFNSNTSSIIDYCRKLKVVEAMSSVGSNMRQASAMSLSCKLLVTNNQHSICNFNDVE